MKDPKKIPEYKKKVIEQLVKLLQEYPIIGAVNMQNMPAPQLQNMRTQLRENVVLLMSKKRLIKLAIEKAKDKVEGLDKIIPLLEGMPALLFTKENPFKLYKIIQKNKSKAPAKAGQQAPFDIIVPKGPTPFAPGPVISELSNVKIKTGVEGGKVAIKEDSLVAKKGETISANLASILTRLDIHPMEIGLDLVGVLEKGVVYGKDVLAIDDVKFMEDLNNAIGWAFNLSIEAAYPTKDNIELMLGKLFRESKAVALESNFMADAVAEELVGKAEREMLGLKDTANIEVGAPKAEEPKVEEKPAPEEPKVEEKQEAKPEPPKEEPKPEPPKEEPKEKPPEPKVEEKKEEPKEEAKPEPPKPKVEEKKPEPPKEPEKPKEEPKVEPPKEEPKTEAPEKPKMDRTIEELKEDVKKETEEIKKEVEELREKEEAEPHTVPKPGPEPEKVEPPKIEEVKPKDETKADVEKRMDAEVERLDKEFKEDVKEAEEKLKEIPPEEVKETRKVIEEVKVAVQDIIKEDKKVKEDVPTAAELAKAAAKKPADFNAEKLYNELKKKGTLRGSTEKKKKVAFSEPPTGEQLRAMAKVPEEKPKKKVEKVPTAHELAKKRARKLQS